MGQVSLFKTLANKHNFKRYKKICERLKYNGEFIHRYMVEGKAYSLKVFQMKHVRKRIWQNQQVDLFPNTFPLTTSTTEIIQRLNANKCEACGWKGRCEVHHIKKLKDLMRKKRKSYFEEMMIARNRKTLVLCPECHKKLHAGKLEDQLKKRKTQSTY